MKDVLIFYPERKLSPKGGPSGYLYNLNKGLLELNNNDIIFSFYDNAPVEMEENQKLRSVIPKRIKELRRAYKFAHYLSRKSDFDEKCLEYDAIHFHSTEEMYLNREMLEKYKGKVILTSHTPCAPYQEIIGRLNSFDYKIFKKKIDKLVEMDIYAFERADYIIFPCNEAEEPYFNTWPEYENIRNKDKIIYLPTGIAGCKAKINRSEFRGKYGIPENAFVISYAGRHNEIKGYGNLKKIGEKVLQNENVFFLIAGKEGPLYRLENKRWIEVGWTDDPHSLICASDLFMLPNKETYFDLVLLEVMSLGIPVLASYTGGNKYFEKYKLDGLMTYASIEDACNKVDMFSKMNIEARTQAGNAVKAVFEKYFTVNTFANGYINIVRKILK